MLELADLTIYLNNDQPTTCGLCGWRSEWEHFDNENGVYQINICLNLECQHKFITMDD